MNRRVFIKSTAVITTALGLNVVAAKETPPYEFIRIIMPGYINKSHLWIMRSTDINNPIIPTHRLNLPWHPPIRKKSILSNQWYSYLKVGDYQRFSKDIYHEWDKVIEVGISKYGNGDPAHWIKTEKIFPYTSKDIWEYVKLCENTSLDPKPPHQPT